MMSSHLVFCNLLPLSAVLVLASFVEVDAFVPAAYRPLPAAVCTTTTTRPIVPSIILLKAEASSGGEEGETHAAEEALADDEGEDEEEEEEEQEEDPEVTALKDEIADLEKILKDKKGEIQYLKESTETYSKAGYARKVAEMENMRRARSSMASSNRETSIATVLRNFLPVKDKLDMMREQYGEDDFGKQYGALAGNLNTAFTEMGVTEYTASVGEPIDRTRVLVVDEQYSTELPKDTVLQPLRLGMELKGNVIRLAECVASLGEESIAGEIPPDNEDDDEDGDEETSEAGEEAEIPKEEAAE